MKKAFSPQNIILTLSQAARLKKRQSLTYFGQKIIKILLVRFTLSKGMRGEIRNKIHNTIWVWQRPKVFRQWQVWRRHYPGCGWCQWGKFFNCYCMFLSSLVFQFSFVLSCSLIANKPFCRFPSFFSLSTPASEKWGHSHLQLIPSYDFDPYGKSQQQDEEAPGLHLLDDIALLEVM